METLKNSLWTLRKKNTHVPKKYLPKIRFNKFRLIGGKGDG